MPPELTLQLQPLCIFSHKLCKKSFTAVLINYSDLNIIYLKCWTNRMYILSDLLKLPKRICVREYDKSIVLNLLGKPCNPTQM